MRVITVDDYNKALEELKSEGINTFDVVILDRLTEILQEVVVESEEINE